MLIKIKQMGTRFSLDLHPGTHGASIRRARGRVNGLMGLKMGKILGGQGAVGLDDIVERLGAVPAVLFVQLDRPTVFCAL